MKIKCEFCSNIFDMSRESISAINQFIHAEKDFCKISCTKCKMDFLYEIKIHSPNIPPPKYRCPSEACSGWLNWVDELWGCGHCGENWSDVELINAISSIIYKHPHRSRCYTQESFGFLPLDKEPEDYEEIVSKES